MKPKELLEQWNDREQKLQLLEIALFLSLATIFFYVFNTNMLMFGIFVYLGLAWLIYKTPNRKLSLLTGILGGFIGFCTEWWGCPNQLWNWTEPQISLLYLFGKPYGFPVEVVVAYFSAGFWIGKITLILFDPQVRDTIDFYDSQEFNESIKWRVILAMIITAMGITIIILEIMWIQAMLLLSIGCSLFLLLPKRVMGIVAPFAMFMGAVGFFFENFATGIIPGFSVWQYDVSLYDNLVIPDPVIGVAPISAFVAYMGTGLILFSSSFILNRVVS